jgi:hypothetical protein
MPCVAPSEIIQPGVAAAFGLIAEKFIGKRYLTHVGRSAFYPANPLDFQDIHRGFSNVRLFISFLKDHNPKLSLSQIAVLSGIGGMVRVPDLMTDDATRKEFYEIKPNSIDGNAAGLAKIAALDALFAFTKLPYKPGRTWSPDEKVPIFSGSMFGRNIEGSFHYFKKSPGLIVYEICIDGDLLDLALEVIVAIILAIIIIIISRGRVPIPGPAPVPVA